MVCHISTSPIEYLRRFLFGNSLKAALQRGRERDTRPQGMVGNEEGRLKGYPNRPSYALDSLNAELG